MASKCVWRKKKQSRELQVPSRMAKSTWVKALTVAVQFTSLPQISLPKLLLILIARCVLFQNGWNVNKTLCVKEVTVYVIVIWTLGLCRPVQCPWRLPLATREALPLPTTLASPRSHLLRWSVPAAHSWASTVPALVTWEISKQPCCHDSSSFLRLMSQTSPWNFLLWSTISPLCLFGWPAILLIFCGLSSFFF